MADVDPWGIAGADDTQASAGWLPSEQEANEALQGIAPGAVITSGARTPEHNAAVGGVPDSMHIGGDAVDFQLPKGMTADQVKAQLQSQGYPVSEFIDEGTHVHWGWRPKGNVGPAEADPWGVAGSKDDPWAVQQTTPATQQNAQQPQQAGPGWGDVIGAAIRNTPARWKQMGAGVLEMLAETPNQFMPRSIQAMEFGPPVVQDTPQDIKDKAAISQWAHQAYANAAADIKASSPNVDNDTAKRIASQLVSGSIDILPVLAATAITRNPVVGGAMMGGQAAGSTYGAARASGRSADQARLDAAFSGIVNGGLGALPLGVVMRPGQTFLGKTLQSAGSFGAVSVATEALQIGYDKGLVNPKMTLKDAWQRVEDAGIVGTLQGALLGGGHAGLESAVGRFRSETAAPTPEARIEPTAASTAPQPAAAPIPTPHPDLAASIGLKTPGKAPAVDPWAPVPETPNPAATPESFRTTPAAIAGEHELEVARLEAEGAQAAAQRAQAPTEEFPPIAARPVGEDVAHTSAGREVPVQYAVVDARHLIPSQTQEGAPNPAFPAELQPRDRTRAASQAQIASIAQNLNPRLLDKSAMASDGAPIIAPDGTVESGNGRTLAIQRAYAEGQPGAAAYRDYLAKQGYPVEGMDAPMLVRVRQGDMTPEERQDFVREANSSGQLGYSATERAQNDAAALPDQALELYRGGDVALAQNRPFVQAFLREIPEAERASLIGPEGELSQEAIRRLNGALFTKAYDAPDLVAQMVESPDTNIKAIGGAMTDVAPEWSKMRARAANGDIPPNLDQTDRLLDAVRLVDQARKEGRNVAEYVGQRDMFTGKSLDPDTEAWLRLMFRDTRNWTNPVGREKLAQALRFYSQEAMKAQAGGNLLGLEPTAPGDILGLAKERIGGGAQGQNAGGGAPLFAEPGVRSFGEPGAGPGAAPSALEGGGRAAAGSTQPAAAANAAVTRLQKLDEEAKPTFYSALDRAVSSAHMKRAPAKDWYGFVDNLHNKGVKQEEIDWSGIRQWLADQKGPVTKDQVQNFLRENNVQVQEVQKGQAQINRQSKYFGPEVGRALRESSGNSEDDLALTLANDAKAYAELMKKHPELENDDDWVETVMEDLVPGGEGRNEAKYGEYALPGGENYRELLLTLPPTPPDAHFRAQAVNRELMARYGTLENAFAKWTPEERARFDRAHDEASVTPDVTYNSSHWEEPNVLAHVRFDDRNERTYTPEKAVQIGERIAKALGIKNPKDIASAGPQRAVDLGAITPIEAAQWEHARGWLDDNQAAARGVMKKTLHVAEVQSDWHQEGRRRGYGSAVPEELQRKVEEAKTVEKSAEKANDDAMRDYLASEPGSEGDTSKLTKAQDAQRALARARSARLAAEHEAHLATANRVPDAPFKTSWHELAMKRMLRYAAEHGYDRITWDTGETNAARYDLSKHLDHIELRDNETGSGLAQPSMEGDFKSGRLIGYDHTGHAVIDRHIGSPEELVQAIGKDAADKILKVEPKAGRSGGLGHRVRDLPNADLKIGGEGMRGFYDRILPQFMAKYVKKWGAKVGSETLRRTGGVSGEQALREIGVPENEIASTWRTMGHEERNHILEDFRARGTKVHSVDITPAMKESVMHGQPLFRKEAGPFGKKTRANAQGLTRLSDDILARLPETPTPREQKVLDEVAAIAKKIVPKAPIVGARELQYVEPGTTRSAMEKGYRVGGATTTNGLRRLIAWSLSSRDPIGTMRHEAIHYLKQEGFFTPSEWHALETAAEQGNWLRRHNILSRYRDLDRASQLEEAIAEQFGTWRRAPSVVPKALRPVFERIARVLGSVGKYLRETFGSSSAAHDIFDRIEEGRIGRRGVGMTPAETRLERQPEETDIRDYASHIKEAAARTMDMVHDVEMMVAPMSQGGNEARATAKDFANLMRLARYHGNRMMEGLKKDFAPYELKRMWEAADEESVARQTGKSTEGIGLSRLTPRERDAVLAQQADAQAVWDAAKQQGMVQGEGLPSYVPRMLVDMAEGSARRLGSASDQARSIPGVGKNVRTSTPQMRHRKYLTTAETEGAGSAKFGTVANVVKDIRTLPLATMKLREAVAGRALINQIKEIGRRTGEDTVVEGHHPDTPGWFTIDNPAFKTWRPKFITDELTGKVVPATDQNGQPVFEKVPIYVRSDFEGPLRAVLTEPTSKVYNALMDLKSKAMTTIMYSPLIHNAVEWGRALPAMPGKVLTLKVYFEGNRAKNDPAQMTEAIMHGLVPIGHRAGGMQDVTGIADADSVKAGRSWTAKVIGAVPGLFSRAARDQVYQAIDRLGDLWHNTLLWDRVGDLQMGLYTNIRDDLVRKGYSPDGAAYTAAHLANRYAGALPTEAMSQMSRKIANLMLFSRTYTLGNLGAMKDTITGLPRDVQAQIERAGGQMELDKVKSMARRKAISIMLTDIALYYASNSLLQSGLAYLSGRQDLNQVEKGYIDRLNALAHKTTESPLSLLNPFADLQSLSATSENEPGRENRVLVGYDKDGTAIYARNPTGKIGEEFVNWSASPLQTLKQKLGTLARPTYQLIANDAGFGRKIYDPKGGVLHALGNIAQLYMGAQVPLDSLKSAANLIEGKAKGIDAYKVVGPLAGVTFSKGAPGGPAVGAFYELKDRQQAALQEALPDIHEKFDGGDRSGAYKDLITLGVKPSLARWYIRIWSDPRMRANPRAVNQLLMHATPEDREMYNRVTGAQ